MNVVARLKHAWNALKDENLRRFQSYGSGSGGYGHRPDRMRYRYSNERSIISSIYTRLAIDAAAIDIRHVRRDEDGHYVEDINSGLQNCLTLEANVDQGARHFRQDVFMSLFDQGVIAIVPIDTSVDPSTSAGFDIKTMRVGKVVGWFPRHVRVEVYNDAPDKGYREQLTLEKKYVAIVENPLYTVMNEPNSTLQRLIRKLNLLDIVDDQISSGKLDIIIQLPYVIKSEAKREQARQRRLDIEEQLTGSKYGVAYTDGTEKITQLNRPAENNLLEQIKQLTELLYSQLGLTTDVMNGTADESAMVNYYNRTTEPIVAAVVEAMRRAFLTKTARSQGQWLMAFRDPFKMLTLKDLAEIADKFTRSEMASSNDLRAVVGWKPSTDPKANELRNTNLPLPTPSTAPADQGTVVDDAAVQSGIDNMNATIDEIFKDLGVDESAFA
jgi:hypothetical protein